MEIVYIYWVLYSKYLSHYVLRFHYIKTGYFVLVITFLFSQHLTMVDVQIYLSMFCPFGIFYFVYLESNFTYE